MIIVAHFRRKSLGIAMALCAPFAYADGPDDPIPSFYQEPGKSPNRDYSNQHPNEHIDPFTGKLQWHFVDLFIPGNGGFDLKVQRSYSSQSEAFPTPSNAGAGWTMNFGRVLRTAASNICDMTTNLAPGRNPVLELPDGSRQMMYIGTDNASFISQSFWKATCIQTGGLTVYSPDGTRYDMDYVGATEGSVTRPSNAYYPSHITDRNGNSMTLSYVNLPSTTGVSTVTTSDGRTVTFTYDASGNVKTVSDGTRTWTYTYQASGSLANVFYMIGVQRPDGLSWTFEYNDGAGSAGAASMQSATYPTGGKINYTYDFVTFNANPNLPRSTVVSTKVSDGATWNFTYVPATTMLPADTTTWSNANLIPPMVDATTIKGPDGSHVYYHLGYSSVPAGNVFAIGQLMSKWAGNVEGVGHTWGAELISYQDNARPGNTLISDSYTLAPILVGQDVSRDGQHAMTRYDALDVYGNPGLITETGTDVRRTTKSYYVNTSKWILHQKKDESAEILSANPVESLGSITRTFDANGNMLTENRYGVTTTFTYSAAGDIATRTDANGNVSTYSNYKRGMPQSETHPEGATITRVIDAAGNITSQTDGENATTSYTYDGLNRLTHITHPTGNAVTIAWGKNSRTVSRGGYTEKLTFDGFGRQTLSEHMGAGATIYQSATFDALGRATFKSYPSSAAGTTFTYDVLGRVLTATHPAANSGTSSRTYVYDHNNTKITNERGLTTKHTYRMYGDPDKSELMQVVAPDPTANIVMTRNGLGQMTQVTQNGKTRSFEYNSKFFLVTKTDPETGVSSYGRDNLGNMTSRQVGASPPSTFTYDGLNRHASASYPGMTTVAKTYYKDDKLKTMDTGLALRSFVYDPNKNLTSETMTIGSQVFTTTYGYDGNDAMSSLTYGSGKTITYNPDALGRPTQASPYVTQVTHHPTGAVATISYANGITTSVGLNPRMWPATMSVAGRQAVFNTSYAYDENGNIASVSDAIDTSYNRSMSYDAIDRLVAANGSWGQGTFSYDGRGNVTSQKLGTFALGYSYDPGSDRLLNTSGSRVSSFSYDVYGNVTNNGTTAFSYNNASDMTCAKCGQADQSLFDYDGSNMRVRVQKNGVTTYFMYGLDGKLLWERTPNSNIKEYIYLGGKQIATRQQAISVP